MIIAPCQQPDYCRVVGKKARVGIVIIDRPYAASRYATIASDNFTGCLNLTRETLKEGGRRTAFLCANPEIAEHRGPYPRLFGGMPRGRRSGLAGPRLPGARGQRDVGS